MRAQPSGVVVGEQRDAVPGALRPAAHRVCARCPWRADDRRARGGRDPALDAWRRLRSGEPAACVEELGGGVLPRECAGALVALLRELALLHAAGSLEDYWRRRPAGLTGEAFERLRARLVGRAGPAVRRPATAPAEVVDVPSRGDLVLLDYATDDEVDQLSRAVRRIQRSLRR